MLLRVLELAETRWWPRVLALAETLWWLRVLALAEIPYLAEASCRERSLQSPFSAVLPAWRGDPVSGFGCVSGSLDSAPV